MTEHAIRLDRFDSEVGLDRGRSRPTEVLWYIVKVVFFLTAWPWPSRLKCTLLRAFGASVGQGVVLRPRLNIHMPWKLALGSNCWLGERCEILNFAKVTMEEHSALAHDVYVAAAGHDISSPTMRYKHAPVTIESGVWVATRAYIGPGVHIGRNAVVAAGAVVVGDVPPNSLVAGVPARVTAERRIRSSDDPASEI